MADGKTWLLVADASKARIYAMHKAKLFQDPNPRNLEVIGSYEHPDSRKKASELISDKAGELSPGVLAGTTSPKLHEAEEFALELLRHLEKGRNDNSFNEVVLVAPATFMGLLNKHISNGLRQKVSKTIEKDYTSDSEINMLKNLIEHL